MKSITVALITGGLYVEAVNGSVCLTAAEIDIFWDPIVPPNL